MRSLIAILVLGSISANAEPTFHKTLTAPMTKFEAMREAFNNPSTTLFKCQEVGITEKASFKALPTSRNNFVDQAKGIAKPEVK